LINIHI